MTSLILPRRRFLAGALALIAAPTIVRAASIMPVRPVHQWVTYRVSMSTPEIIRIWYGERLVYQAVIKSVDWRLERAS